MPTTARRYRQSMPMLELWLEINGMYLGGLIMITSQMGSCWDSIWIHTNGQNSIKKEMCQLQDSLLFLPFTRRIGFFCTVDWAWVKSKFTTPSISITSILKIGRSAKAPTCIRFTLGSIQPSADSMITSICSEEPTAIWNDKKNTLMISIKLLSALQAGTNPEKSVWRDSSLHLSRRAGQATTSFHSMNSI